MSKSTKKSPKHPIIQGAPNLQPVGNNMGGFLQQMLKNTPAASTSPPPHITQNLNGPQTPLPQRQRGHNHPEPKRPTPIHQSQRRKNSRRRQDELTTGCHLCEWKGYITYAKDEFAEVRPCSCQEEVCPKCNNEGGYEVILETGSRAWRVCDCQQNERRMERFRNAKIPARFCNKTLDAFAPNDKTQARVRAHLYQSFYNPTSQRPFKTGDPGVVLMGPPGVGKTHLMVGFIRNLILERKISCRFQDFGLLLSDLRDNYTRGLSEMEVLGPLIRVDVLLIDDLGKGRNSKWESGIIDTLISSRYNAKRTTLITTNYTDSPETTLRERYRGRGSTEGEELLMRDTLADRVGERVYSRLSEMNEFFYINGRDYRQK